MRLDPLGPFFFRKLFAVMISLLLLPLPFKKDGETMLFPTLLGV